MCIKRSEGLDARTCVALDSQVQEFMAQPANVSTFCTVHVAGEPAFAFARHSAADSGDATFRYAKDCLA